METISKKREKSLQATQTLWHQLTPLQREQMAVVVLRIVRQWQTQTQLQEVEDEPVNMVI